MILLDTHALIWALREPTKLSAYARQTINQATAHAVSAASIFEISLKGRLGKWPAVEDLLTIDLTDQLTSFDIEVVPANGQIMQRAGAFDWHHRDPFDRLIVASALQLHAPVISKDETLDTLGDPDWRRVW